MLRLPINCTLCGKNGKHRHAICDDCHNLLPSLSTTCDRCALPLPQGTFLQCGACLKHPPTFDRIFVAHRFEEPLRTLLHEFKYQAGLYLTSFIGDLMLQALPKDYHTECLLPVPMHPKRLRERGFNQAAVLTHYLSRRLHCPRKINGCNKSKHTPPQADLSGKQRHHNVKDAFTAKPLSFNHVTVIDDIMTTGSTANALALALKQRGITTVDVWCCARAC